MEASTSTCSTSPLVTVAEKAGLGLYWNLAAAKIMKEPKALDFLVKSLSQEDDRNLQKLAAKTLRNLAASEDHSVKLQILNGEGALKGLVKCLQAERDPYHGDVVKKIALQTLGNLTAADENCRKIVNDEGARKCLVECLYEHDRSALQEQAAWVLKELARGSPRTILEDERAVLGIMKALSRHGQPGLQESALTLLLLASEQLECEVIDIMTNGDEDVFHDLVECLSAIENRGVQKSALRLLSKSLRHDCDDHDDVLIEKLILNEVVMIRGLLKCMLAIDDHDLQEGALGFLLDDLWEDHESVKESFADHEDAITGLVTCMSATDKPSLQLKAIRVLVNLASYKKDYSVREEIAAQILENGAVEGFVKNLSANCDLQKETAAAALASLAEVDGAPVKQRIIDEDGAISGLVGCLSSTSPGLKREATRALQNITKGSGSCWKRRKIVP